MPEPTFEEIDALAREMAVSAMIGPGTWAAMDENARNYYRLVAAAKLNKRPYFPTLSTLGDATSPSPPTEPTPQRPSRPVRK
jgi:hypothetical protein